MFTKLFEAISTLKELNPNLKNNQIAPALLTWDEYYKIINYNDKFHDSSAYDWSYTEEQADVSKGKLINTVRLNGLMFKFYEFKRYVKYGKWDGDIYLGTMSEEEILKCGLSPFQYEYICVYDGVSVGYALDEWGCVLISVVKEFRGFGIGEKLVKLYREKYPYKPSGGFTENGYKQIKKYYNWMVNRAMSNGIYTDMIRKGEIDKSRVKEILSSMDKNYKFKKEIKQKKEYIKPEKEAPIYLISDNTIIIFDENIKNFKDVELDIISDKNLKSHIYCYIHIVYYNDFPQIYDAYGVDKYLIQGIRILAALNEDGLGDYYFRNFNPNLVSKLNIIWDSEYFTKEVYKDKGYISSVSLNVIRTNENLLSHIKELKRHCGLWFKKNDEYDELYHFITETAYGYTD